MHVAVDFVAELSGFVKSMYLPSITTKVIPKMQPT